MYQYIDIQFFKIQHMIIVKELCIMINDAIEHYVFKNPFDYKLLSEDEKQHVRWVEKYYHQLKWTSGHTPYEELDCILRKLWGSFFLKD